MDAEQDEILLKKLEQFIIDNNPDSVCLGRMATLLANRIYVRAFQDARDQCDIGTGDDRDTCNGCGSEVGLDGRCLC